MLPNEKVMIFHFIFFFTYIAAYVNRLWLIYGSENIWVEDFKIKSVIFFCYLLDDLLKFVSSLMILIYVQKLSTICGNVPISSK